MSIRAITDSLRTLNKVVDSLEIQLFNVSTWWSQIPWWAIVIITICLLIIVAVISRLSWLNKLAHLQESEKKMSAELSVMRFEENRRKNWETEERKQLSQLNTIIGDWLSREIKKAQVLRRSELELKNYAEKNFKEVLSKEKEILAEYEKKLQDPNVQALIKIPDSVSGQYSGELKNIVRFFIDFLLSWYEEDLKILYYARDFQARGGVYLEKLHEETFQKIVFDLRQKYLEEVEKREDEK